MEKALKSDIDKINREFNRFALYEDFKQLVARLEPQVDDFAVNMAEFSTDNALTKEIVGSFDTSISLKANKTEFVLFENKLRDMITRNEFEQRS